MFREVVSLDDGGVLGLDWLIPDSATDTTPLVIMLPGITGRMNVYDKIKALIVRYTEILVY